MKLLLVEDSVPDARLVQILLREIDVPIETTHVTTLGDALTALSEADFDCAMVDLGLPDGQGVENVQRIDSLAPQLPIVVMTGLDDEKTAAAAMAQGAQAYLVKGSTESGQALKEVLDAAIESKSVPAATRDADLADTAGYINLARTASPDDTFCCNLEGEIDHWSDGARKVYGYEPATAVGMDISRLIPDDRPTEWSLIKKRVEADEAMHGFETVRVTLDGNRRLVELYISPRHNNKGELDGSVWITRDITQQKQAESASRQLAAIVESSNDAIIGTRLDTTILSWNSGAERLLGYSEQEAVGQQISFVTPETLSDSVPALVKRVTSERKLDQMTTQLKRKDGSLVDVSISISPVRDDDGSIIGISGIVRDITELKDAQDQLLQAEKLASLGGLVAGVAHEINTPVGVGVTAASHLKRKVTQFNELITAGGLKRSQLDKFLSTTSESSDIILSNLQRAAELIHSFKQVAVDQSSSEARKFNVREYLDEIFLSLRPQLKRTEHVINIDCDETLQVDSIPGAWSQIITNLVQNSLIHAFDEGVAGQLDIRIAGDSHHLNLTYSDNGKGMPPEVAAHIFDPFFTTRRGQGGSGLGMHVVFNLATQKLGGEIEVHSALGEGTRFELKLPRTEQTHD